MTSTVQLVDEMAMRRPDRWLNTRDWDSRLLNGAAVAVRERRCADGLRVELPEPRRHGLRIEESPGSETFEQELHGRGCDDHAGLAKLQDHDSGRRFAWKEVSAR